MPLARDAACGWIASARARSRTTISVQMVHKRRNVGECYDCSTTTATIHTTFKLLTYSSSFLSSSGTMVMFSSIILW
eukprot:scaffold15050_cov66-Phaeocystis_antarctica.AAC.5